MSILMENIKVIKGKTLTKSHSELIGALCESIEGNESAQLGDYRQKYSNIPENLISCLHCQTRKGCQVHLLIGHRHSVHSFADEQHKVLLWPFLSLFFNLTFAAVKITKVPHRSLGQVNCSLLSEMRPMIVIFCQCRLCLLPTI